MLTATQASSIANAVLNERKTASQIEADLILESVYKRIEDLAHQGLYTLDMELKMDTYVDTIVLDDLTRNGYEALTIAIATSTSLSESTQPNRRLGVRWVM